MKDKKIYCHTTYDYTPSINIIKGNWYIIDNIIGDYYVIRHSKNHASTILIDSVNNYFYTEQEYNRIKGLNELLDER